MSPLLFTNVEMWENDSSQSIHHHFISELILYIFRAIVLSLNKNERKMHVKICKENVPEGHLPYVPETWKK